MNPGSLFFHNRHLLGLSILVIVVAGFSSLQTLPRLEDPVITNRGPVVLTVVPGADAERVEALVSERIETELQSIPQIKNIDSTSQSGFSLVAVELRDDVTDEDNDAIFSEIRDKLSAAEHDFPPEALSPLLDDDRGPVAFTAIAALTTNDPEPNLGLLKRLALELADDFRTISGTELAKLYGEPEEEILATVDRDELVAMGMTVEEITRALAASDAREPGGTLPTPGSDFQLEVEGEFDSLARISQAVLREQEDGTSLRLSDVAEISQGWQEPVSQIAITNGQRAIYVAAQVRQDQRVDVWAEQAQEVVENFSDRIGEGVEVRLIYEQNKYTQERLGSLVSNLLLGAAVVVVVIFFSMGWRSAILVGTALPLSAAMTLFIVAFMGGKIHQMSIFGMIIALGLLIDNAIVVSDEINRHLKAGMERGKAVGAAFSHLFIPLLSSTLTTVFAFMPILLLPGNAGDFVGSIGSSVIYALVSSFLISMTIIAALTGIFGARREPGQKRRWWRDGVGNEQAGERSLKVLTALIKRPWASIPIVCTLSVAGFMAASTLGVQFFPLVDRNQFEIRFWKSPEVSLQATTETAREMEEKIRSWGDIHNIHWLTGASFPPVYYNMMENRDNTAYFGQAIVEVEDFQTVKRLIPVLQERLDEEFPEIQAIVRQFAQGPPSTADVEFRLVGESTEALKRLGEEVRLLLSQHPDVLHTRQTLLPGQPKIRFDADEEEVRLTGLTLSGVAAQMRANLNGLTGGSIIEGLEELPVRVRFADSDRNTMEALRAMNLTLPGSSDTLIPLQALGDVELEPETSAISRRNNERVNTVQAWVRNGSLPIVATQEVQAQLEASGFQLPPNYRLEVGGDSENQAEAMGSLFRYLPILLILAVATIILSFRSVGAAVILVLVGMIASGYGMLATWAMGFPLSFNTILGTFGLIGLALNDNIVVLAGIRANPDARAGDWNAIARSVQNAMRHLVSTTLTTIGGFLPLLIFVGGDFWPPLAIVLAGGVGGATLAALLFTPTVYGLLARTRFGFQSA